MNDLLRELLTETRTNFDFLAADFGALEHDLVDAHRLEGIFAFVHTLRAHCGSIGLSRLRRLAGAAEHLIENFRYGLPVTHDRVVSLRAAFERIRSILADLDRCEREPEGSDEDLIASLQMMAERQPPVVAEPLRQLASQSLLPGEARDLLEKLLCYTQGQEAGSALPVCAEPQSAPLGKSLSSARPQGEYQARQKVGSQSVSPAVENLETLMAMVSELVLTRNQLLEILHRHEESEFRTKLQQISKVAAELAPGDLVIRREPIGNAWQKLPGMVRDLAAELGKTIELEMHGGEAELDRHLLPVVEDAMIQMVGDLAHRGIETPAERRSTDKPENGTIRLCAHRQDGHVIIEIADDGRGLDPDDLRGNGGVQGPVAAADLESSPEALAHHRSLARGSSKNASASGAFGMALVHPGIAQINGTIELKAIRGEGSSFIIKIPTATAVPALIVKAAHERFAIPLASVTEAIAAEPNPPTEGETNRPVLRLRNNAWRCFHLTHLLQLADGSRLELAEETTIVVMKSGGQRLGLIVDQMLHSEQIVVRPMPSRLRDLGVFAGSAILADGSVTLVLDSEKVISRAGFAAVNAPLEPGETDYRNADPQPQSLLVFRAGSPGLKAVPLSLVTRIEQCEGRKLEFANGRWFMPNRGSLMPLICLEDETLSKLSASRPLLVFSHGSRSVGLVIDEVVDILEDKLDGKVVSNARGTRGAPIMRGQLIDMIDLTQLLPLAAEDRNNPVRGGGPGDSVPSLLLVEHAAFFRNMLTPVLKVAGFAVTGVPRAEEALELIRTGQRFDVILSDIEMPGMNGFEFAEVLGADPLTAQIPLIALSSMIEPATVERGRKAGFREFVAKFDRQSLIAALKSTRAERTEAA
jgi:two-component system, chemotaxis family, sensor kinase CheA